MSASVTNIVPNPLPVQLDAWDAPTMIVLPVEETATNISTGDDGNGATTGS